MSKPPTAFHYIPEGRELLDALSALPFTVGWVLASGSLDDIELKLSGRDAGRIFSGRFTLVGLSGPLGGPYGVTLSRWDGERCEVAAGIVVRAMSAGVQVVCVEGAQAEPLIDAPAASFEETKVPLVAPPTPLVAPPTPLVASTTQLVTAPAPGFAARAARVAQALRAAEEEPEDLGEPEQGDHVQHFAFGLCEVLTATGDRLVIRDLSRAGRIREISTDMLVIHAPVEIEGKRVFRLTRRG